MEDLFSPLACYFKTNTGRNQSNSLDQPVGQDQNTSDLEPMLTVGLHSSPRVFCSLNGGGETLM